ncbi:hypothetical protein NQ314_010688 [Rhamnusium bicolor]|uniref:CHK kinase-like domain-containing protein n=1 Tax=Rhamnusium bicolor TaxID=1586634 RepID=A0AAV8XPK5_9CUCU|nr:hypothetical protein NQ314_010688 [Rhamnusium bicolor]
MLKLDVTLKNNNDGSEEQMHAVAKQIPDNEFTQKVFNTQVTYKNEIAMYATIMPTLQMFQKEHGVHEVIDCYPKLYGARINLHDKGDIVDENAVILLENLFASGYSNIDRHVGFDLETAQLILKDLAAFHAVPLALKLKKPEVFDKKVKPYLTPFIPPTSPENEETKESMETVMVEMLKESVKCIPFISKIEEALERSKNRTHASPPREPFATVTHGDMWVNNTLIKFENGKPIKNKLVDFQVCDYKSPATDLFFFLFTSVQKPVLEEYLDELVQFYHRHFISHLEKLHCDIVPFSFDNFLEEMRLGAAAEITHTLIMIVFIVLAKKGGFSGDMDPDKPPDFDKMRKNMRNEAKEKAQFMIQLCGNRRWL